MVHVRLFAGLRDLAGRGEVKLEWREGLTVGEVRGALARRYPAIAPLLERSRAAVGEQLAEDSATIPDESEVAFLPPVSGG